MPLYVRYCESTKALELFLQGAVVCGRPLEYEDGKFGFHGLVGLTLTFTSPSGTVTFVAGQDPSGFLTFEEIKTQVTSAVSGIDVKVYERRIVFQSSTIGTSIEVGSNVDEPGRAIFGLTEKSGIFDGTAYNPPDGAAPRLISITPGAGGTFVVVTEET